jgi:spore photoproduct lyase
MSTTSQQKALSERSNIVHRPYKGEFWKPCPGTTGGYLCCGYQVLSPMTGCGMYCSYCILQTYFEDQRQVVFDNFDDLAREVREKLSRRTGVVRLGTGEFADSLFPEDRLGLSQRVAALLEPYPNVLVEFKTKSTTVKPLDSVKHPERTVVGFSMNTPRMIRVLERNTAALGRRLEAARRCVRKGFWVAFHFDPMVHYPGWEEEYREVVRKIFAAVKDPRRIAWWSLGGFRTMPALEKLLRSRGEGKVLFSGEMILGEDRKLRYFRPVRVAFYRAMADEVEKHYRDTTLYMCMESPEVWEESGMSWRIPDGLPRYLDRRAEEMLGLG